MQSADAASTWRFIHLHGVESEVHPGIRLVIYALGPIAGVIASKLTQSMLLLALAGRWPLFAPWILGITLALTTLAVANNIAGLFGVAVF